MGTDWRKTALRVFLGVLTVAACVFVVVTIVDQWPTLVETWRDADTATLAAGIAVFMVAEVAFAAAWPFTIGRLGVKVGMVEGASLFAVTQTAKWVPGSIWQAVGRLEAANRIGVARKATGASLVVEAGASLFAALVIAAVTLTPARVFDHHGLLALAESVGAVVAGVAAVVIAHRIAGRVWTAPPFGHLVAILAWQLAVWSAYGVAAAIVAWSLGVGDPLAVAGAFCLSWAVGFVIVVAPAGLGVREAVMTAALAEVTTTAGALAVSVSTRVVWTAVQLGAALVGLAVMTHIRRSRRTGATPPTDATMMAMDR